MGVKRSETKDKLLKILEPITQVFEILPEYHSLSPAQYDSHRLLGMPHSRTLKRRTGLSWEEILRALKLPLPLGRDTLARLSRSLHLLEKRIVSDLGVGWEERSFRLPCSGESPKKPYRRIRPDSCCMDRLYLNNKRLILLDVKLSLSSAAVAIYKYLPVFKKPREYLPVARQLTFFPEWTSEKVKQVEPSSRAGPDGQIYLFGENHLLYICYLLGTEATDLCPGDQIASWHHRPPSKEGPQPAENSEWKTLPGNMEVRFIPFEKLPNTYCYIAGIEYTGEPHNS